MIKIEDSYDLFISALNRLNKSKLNYSDADLACEIFEELDTEAHSFLHENTVNRLIDGNFIPSVIKNDVLELRKEINHLIETKRTIEEYRNSNEWENVRTKAEKILNRIV